MTVVMSAVLQSNPADPPAARGAPAVGTSVPGVGSCVPALVVLPSGPDDMNLAQTIATGIKGRSCGLGRSRSRAGTACTSSAGTVQPRRDALLVPVWDPPPITGKPGQSFRDGWCPDGAACIAAVEAIAVWRRTRTSPTGSAEIDGELGVAGPGDMAKWWPMMSQLSSYESTKESQHDERR